MNDIIYYYSPSTKGFYNTSVHGDNIPDDKVEISREYWMELMSGESSGKIITPGENGYPYLADPPPPTEEDIRRNALYQRDNLLRYAALRIAPLQDAVDLDDATDEEVALLKKWKQYRVALNRIQDQAGFPNEINWPALPEPMDYISQARA